MIELPHSGCIFTASIFMKDQIITTIMTAVFLVSGQPTTGLQSPVPAVQEHVIGEHAMSLDTRYANQWVNNVFKDNILLNVAYLSGKVKKASDINWNEIRKPSTSEITLNPGDVFAYHDDILPEYKGKTITTQNSHFGAGDGYRSSGLLFGDGVCHLASLMNWAARDAGLTVVSKVNHNFANIPEVPREYGTSIYATGSNSTNGQMQNLYIENTKAHPVRIVFTYADNILKVSIEEDLK